MNGGINKEPINPVRSGYVNKLLFNPKGFKGKMDSRHAPEAPTPHHGFPKQWTTDHVGDAGVPHVQQKFSCAILNSNRKQLCRFVAPLPAQLRDRPSQNLIGTPPIPHGAPSKAKCVPIRVSPIFRLYNHDGGNHHGR